jgi:transposase
MSKKVRLVAVDNQAGARTPAPGTEVKIAIDLARTKWVYCVRWGGQEQHRQTTPAELKHVQALVARYPGCPVHLAFEACGFGYEIAWWAQAQGIAVTVVAPSRMERTPGLQVKTDRIDAGKMARKLEQGELKGIAVPSQADHEKRQVVRTYAQALKERKRGQNRIRSLMQEHGRLGPLPSAGWKVYRQWLETQPLAEEVQLCVDTLLAMRTMAETQATMLKARLLRIAAGAEYRQIVDALCTHPGVGPLSAIRFILEIGDIHRFATADSIGHYLGLTPSEYSSGDLVQRGSILKCGPGTLRAAMLQCGWASVRKGGDATLKEVFERVALRAGRKRAIVAVTRRLVVRLRARWLAAVAEPVAATA